MKTLRYSAVLAAAIAWTSGMAQAEVTLSVLIDNNPETVSSMEAVTAAYMASNPDVTFDIEQAVPMATTSSRLALRRARWRTYSTTTPGRFSKRCARLTLWPI